MKYVEFESNCGDYVRIGWAGGSIVNLYTPIGGEWVEYDCFTDYDIITLDDAVQSAIETINASEEV